jgi:uncharacterized protein (TIGR03663 family)
MNKRAFAGLFLAVFCGALVFRLADPAIRPMHHDESNQALKFGALLERGEYVYDKADHHGPSLYYLSLPFAWVFSRSTLAAMDETVLRLVPALFGAASLLLFLLFLPGLSRAAVFCAAVLAAVSPALVYFSRFYIQETLLAFFLVGLLASLWRYLQRPGPGWAGLAGFFAGMAYATKETSVIAFAAVAGALWLSKITSPELFDLAVARPRNPRFSHAFLGFTIAVFIAFLLFSSFLSNPKGIVDSILSFKIYFVRSAEAGWHAKPWHYYLGFLGYSKSASGPAWSEGLILILALLGSASAFISLRNKDTSSRLPRFLFFYTFLSTAAYSLIPYKTPWNLLPFYIGFILLAGFGAVVLVRSAPGGAAKAIVILALMAGAVHLGLESYRASFKLFADPRNPYVYSQTTPGLLGLIRRTDELASLTPDGKHMFIKVVASPYETWPLPWYLRKFDHVGYWQHARDAGGTEGAPLIISSVDQADALGPSLAGRYQSEFYELRPNVLLVLHVENGLWERFLRRREER